MTTAQLARFLGVDKRTVRRWAAQGKIPEPATRTEEGWAQWSQEQVTEILAWHRSRLPTNWERLGSGDI